MLRLDNFAVGGLSFRASTALLKRHQCAGKKVISIATRLDGISTTLHRQLSCIIMFTNHKAGKTPQDKKWDLHFPDLRLHFHWVSTHHFLLSFLVFLVAVAAMQKRTRIFERKDATTSSRA